MTVSFAAAEFLDGPQVTILQLLLGDCLHLQISRRYWNKIAGRGCASNRGQGQRVEHQQRTGTKLFSHWLNEVFGGTLSFVPGQSFTFEFCTFY